MPTYCTAVDSRIRLYTDHCTGSYQALTSQARVSRKPYACGPAQRRSHTWTSQHTGGRTPNTSHSHCSHCIVHKRSLARPCPPSYALVSRCLFCVRVPTHFFHNVPIRLGPPTLTGGLLSAFRWGHHLAPLLGGLLCSLLGGLILFFHHLLSRISTHHHRLCRVNVLNVCWQRAQKEETQSSGQDPQHDENNVDVARSCESVLVVGERD